MEDEGKKGGGGESVEMVNCYGYERELEGRKDSVKKKGEREEKEEREER